LDDVVALSDYGHMPDSCGYARVRSLASRQHIRQPCFHAPGADDDVTRFASGPGRSIQDVFDLLDEELARR